MKAAKKNRTQLEKLGEVSQHNGKLDRAVVDSALDRILKAAQTINDEVAALLIQSSFKP